MPNAKKVVILKIDDYDVAVLKAKIKAAIDKYFPLANYFQAGDKVLLKPNLLMPAKPDDAVTTHPAIAEAVGSIFKDAGFPVVIADSPGGFIDSQDMAYIYNECGYGEPAKRYGFELLNPERSVLREGIPLCWWADGSFKIINLPKLKTHELTILTLAVKNLYGCISGLHKSQLHINYPQPKNFVEILLKLNGMVKPSLNIIDGILAMEGAGPSKKGTPRKLNVIILSDNALYADFAVGRLLNIKDDAHPLIKAAKERGMLDEKELEIISDAGNFPLARDFVLPSPSILNNIPGGAVNILKAILKFYPRINFEKCVSCGACGTVCPKKAITTIKGKAVIDYKECISCLCCAEMCRFAAIDLKKSFLVRIILLLQMFSKSIVTGLAGLWRRKDARDKIQK